MDSRTYEISGVSPLITHNARLSDPLDKWTRAVAEISGKKKKTEADLLEMARREWFGGLYLDDEDHVIMPGSNVERMIRDAATKTKMGKAVQAGVIVPADSALMFPDRKKAPQALWDLGAYSIRASCKVQTRRVMRTRPMFRKWGVTFEAFYDQDLVNPGQLDEFVTLAGRIVGLGDWRPKYGRFEIKEAK